LLLDEGDPFRGEWGSEPCRKRESPRKPPKLDLPAVEVEVLPLPPGWGVSIDPRPQELVVAARSLKPNLMGGRSGEEKEESRERWVSARSST
jgi:hypothetical protein